MNPMKQYSSGRMPWLILTAAAAAAAMGLRRWQLATAFEPDTGLAIPWAQASVILTCVIIMAGAGLILLAARQPLAGGHAPRWDLVFLEAGDPVYPVLTVAAALLAAVSIPVLFAVGVQQFQIYQDMLAAHLQPPSNNGILTLATAGGAFLAALGLLQMGRDGLRSGRRGKGGFSAALPGVAGCVWLMESFRAHAANPVHWDYVPQLLAIVLGMAFYMDFAGMSAGAARPRRLLWMAGMTVLFSAVSLVSVAAELSALAAADSPILSAQLGDLLLLLSQTAAAAGVLWRLPPSLENPPKPKRTPISPARGDAVIEEETTDE